MTDITRPNGSRATTRALLARIARSPGVAPEDGPSSAGLFVFIVISFLAFGPLKGTLENKFVIPGSDAQKATDVLKAKFGARNGAILQVVFDAKTATARHAERKAAHRRRARQAGKAEYATDVSGPFADDNQRFSKTDPRIGYAEVQFSKDGFELDAQQGRRARGLDAGRRSRRSASRPSSRATPSRRRPSRGRASPRHRSSRCSCC